MQTSLEVRTAWISKYSKPNLEDLREIFDEDDNGNNGVEFLTEEASENGFECNADYFISECVLPNQKIDYEKLCDFACRSGYYLQWECVVTSTQLVLACTSMI